MPEDIVRPPKQSSAPTLDNQTSDAEDNSAEESAPKKISIIDSSDTVESTPEEQVSDETVTTNEPEDLSVPTTETVDDESNAYTAQPVKAEVETEESSSEVSQNEDINEKDISDTPVESESTEEDPKLPVETPATSSSEIKEEDDATNMHAETPEKDSNTTEKPHTAPLGAHHDEVEPELHQKHHVPVIAISVAIVICVALVGIAIYIVMSQSKDTETKNPYTTQAQTTEQTTETVVNPSSEIDSALSEAAQLPTSSDPTTGLTDQTLGL